MVLLWYNISRKRVYILFITLNDRVLIMTNRDTQRKRVYTAEREAFKNHENAQFTFDETKAYVKKVMLSDYYQESKGFKRIKVKDGRGCRNAYYFPSERAVALPKWARKPWVIIHELSHVLAHRTVDDSVGHHASFCTHYANLIAEMVSVKDAQCLIEMFDKHNVLYQARKLNFELAPVVASVPRDRRGKFHELAKKRLVRAIKDVRLLGNLSNTANYEFNREQVDEILTALRTEVRETKSKFEKSLRRLDNRV